VNDRRDPAGAERALLGAVLIDSRFGWRFADKLDEADFASAPHRAVFAAIKARAARCDAVDLVTVQDELEAAGRLGTAGGAAYLAGLLDDIPDVESASTYARMVAEAAAERRLDEALVRAGDAPLSERIELLRTALAAAEAASRRRPKTFTPDEELAGRSPLGPAVATGLPTIDDCLDGGLRSRLHVVLVGAPEAGKTTFAAHVAARWLDASPGHRVLVYARDETPFGFDNRIAQRLGFDRLKLRNGDSETCKAAARALAERWGRRIVHLDPFASHLDELLPEAEALRERGPLLVIVDSLQVAPTVAGEGAASQKERIDAAMDVGATLRDRGDLVLSLSQSNRSYAAAETKDARDPRAEGSGSAGIEFNADALFRFTAKANATAETPKTLSILKSRGGMGKVTVSFMIDRATAVIHELDSDSMAEEELHVASEKLRPVREAIVAALRKAGVGNEKASGAWVEAHVTGKRDRIREALRSLVGDASVFFKEGPRGSHVYQLSSHLAPPRPDLAPGAVTKGRSATSPLAPPPLGGGEVGEDEVAATADEAFSPIGGEVRDEVAGVTS
jgi:replicative DNA helicase